MRWLADLAYLIAGLLYLPVAFYNALILGKNRRGWRERFGGVPRFDQHQDRIWIHAVSLGEVNCTPRLVKALRVSFPDHDIVFSSTTDTGYNQAVHLFGPERVFRSPLDFSVVVSRVLRRLQPSLIVLVELEVWFNLIGLAGARNVPVVVINGRLTERSVRRFRRLGKLGRSMFAKLTWVGAQDDDIAARFESLGVDKSRIDVTSSLKWDSAEVVDHVEGAGFLARALGIDIARPLWVCGSTGPGEELIVLDAYRQLLDTWPDLVKFGPSAGRGKQDVNTAKPILAIVPRKPERFGEVARLIEQQGFDCIRRSENQDGAGHVARLDSGVVLGDTMGELRKFYSLARLVFVGRTLVPMGGSDPMEAAALGKPLVMGPHSGNFQAPVRALHRAGAVRLVETGDQLRDAAAELLANASVAEELGRRARKVVIDNQGATQRTLAGITRTLEFANSQSRREIKT